MRRAKHRSEEICMKAAERKQQEMEKCKEINKLNVKQCQIN